MHIKPPNRVNRANVECGRRRVPRFAEAAGNSTARRQLDSILVGTSGMATAGEDRVQLGLVMSFGRKWQHHRSDLHRYADGKGARFSAPVGSQTKTVDEREGPTRVGWLRWSRP